MKTKKTSYSLTIAGKELTFEMGELAQQATSSILARLGDTMVLVTVVQGRDRDDLGYFPLSVEYVERLYAGGRIKGSRWVKREGRPSDDAVLTGRLIDRSVRPLFPKEYKREVQIVITVLSVDGENEPDILAINAVSAAIAMSPIPWNGPIAAIRVGLVKDKETDAKEFVINPGGAALQLSELDLVVSQSREKTLMIESGALQVDEAHVLEGIKKAHEETGRIIEFIEKITKEVGQPKIAVVKDPVLAEIISQIEKTYSAEIGALIKARATKEGGSSEYDDLITKIFDALVVALPDLKIDKKLVGKAVEYVFFKLIREGVLQKAERADGRKIDEIRPIGGMVGVLPRTHGSAIFQRGTTQALTVVTLGSPRMEQLIESAEGEEAKRYIHHYSMPPYSVGEAGRMGVPSRREIGHGALAERAIMGVIPSQGTFPYTIRVVSEILSSNGSTSMAATCGSTLALMDAGVPILKPVAGIAMGMVSNEEKHVILTDIIGLEDFSGDMDFKVAGTDSGVTAIQLDVKIPGLTIDQIAEVFEKSKKARLFILEKMLAVLVAPRKEVSGFAPKIAQVKIPTEKIGEVIGPGGRIIRNIMAQTGATVDVEDDGTVTISGTSEESVQKAVEWISGLTRELQVGETFEGVVKRILPFGAFVEVLPGKEGMVHVSKMSADFVKDPNDVVQIGQQVQVKVVEIDEQGRVNLTMRMDDTGNEPRGPRPERSERPPRSDQRDQRRVHVDRGPHPMPDAPQGENAHPLTRQFQRERMGSNPNRGRNRGGSKGPYRPGR